MTTLLILATVLATAVLSGVIGMAGGVLLMAVLVTLLPVASAMILHGAVQAASNGARFLFLREHVIWAIVPYYAVGALVAVALFVSLALVPDPALVLILVGSFPWLARVVPTLRGLDVRRPVTAVACGTTVTAAQLLAGASGPLLDAFYLRTEVDRRSIVATKGLTQAAGHVVKIGYYAWVSNAVLDEFSVASVPIWIIGAGIVLAILGARIGTRLLEKFDDRQFRRVTGWVILGLGALCIVKGVRDLLVP